MADSNTMDICKRSEHLVRVKLDEDVGERLLHFNVVFQDSVEIFRNEFHDDVKIHFISLGDYD